MQVSGPACVQKALGLSKKHVARVLAIGSENFRGHAASHQFSRLGLAIHSLVRH
jgi:hypothetical protein